MGDQDRIISVTVGGKKVYEGPDLRHYNRDYQKMFFGISISDYLKAGSVFLSSVVVGTMLWVNLNNRVEMNYRLIMDNKESIKELTLDNAKILGALNAYIRTLDSFLSAVYGEQFDGGKPLNQVHINRGSPGG